MRPQAGSPLDGSGKETEHAQVLVGPSFSAAGLALGSFMTIQKMYGSESTCLFQKTPSSKMKECPRVFPWFIVTPGNLVVTVGHGVRV